MPVGALYLLCVLQVSKWQRGPGLVLWTLTPLATCDLQVYARSLHGGAAGLAEAFGQSYREIPLAEVLRLAKDVSSITEYEIVSTPYTNWLLDIGTVIKRGGILL
jgi:hypothetical protein